SQHAIGSGQVMALTVRAMSALATLDRQAKTHIPARQRGRDQLRNASQVRHEALRVDRPQRKMMYEMNSNE
ncbi:hypothetical protein EE612_008243, partial [Oryza sativa]